MHAGRSAIRPPTIAWSCVSSLEKRKNPFGMRGLSGLAAFRYSKWRARAGDMGTSENIHQEWALRHRTKRIRRYVGPNLFGRTRSIPKQIGRASCRERGG